MPQGLRGLGLRGLGLVGCSGFGFECSLVRHQDYLWWKASHTSAFWSRAVPERGHLGMVTWYPDRRNNEVPRKSQCYAGECWILSSEAPRMISASGSSQSLRDSGKERTTTPISWNPVTMACGIPEAMVLIRLLLLRRG